MQYGALDPLVDRLLLSSHAAPQEAPWGVVSERWINVGAEGSNQQIRKLSPSVFVAVDADKPKWAATVQYRG